MAASKSQESEAIPPNLLKNFNPYTILEPERNNTIDQLIDFSNSTTEIDSTFLPKSNNYELIDVFQDIFVTPQLIQQKRNTPIEEYTEDNSILNIREDDFNQFFDLLESGKKVDWTEVDKLDNHRENIEPAKISDDIKVTPRVLVPKIKLATSKQKEIDPEDLIDEVLAEKNYEKRFLEQNFIQNTKSPEKVVNYDTEKHFSQLNLHGDGAIKKLSAPNISKLTNTTKAVHSSAFKLYNIKTTKDLNAPMAPKIPNKDVYCTTGETKLVNYVDERNFYNNIYTTNPGLSSQELKSLNNTIQSFKSCHFDPTQSEIDFNKFLISCGLGDANNSKYDDLKEKFNWNSQLSGDASVENLKLPPYNMDIGNCNKGDYSSFTSFTLKGIKRDEKLYRKKRIIIPDCIKKNYTKGPSFEEKSVFLPQFMARMAEDQKCLDSQRNFRKRFILDKGIKHSKSIIDNSSGNVHIENNLLRSNSVPVGTAGSSLSNGFGIPSPIILNEDCNQDRLKDMIQSKKFQSFVNGI